MQTCTMELSLVIVVLSFLLLWLECMWQMKCCWCVSLKIFLWVWMLQGGIVNNTLRPTIPRSCDPGWRSLMEKCWAADAAARPTFSEIARSLRAMEASLNVKGQGQTLILWWCVKYAIFFRCVHIYILVYKYNRLIFSCGFYMHSCNSLLYKRVLGKWVQSV